MLTVVVKQGDLFPDVEDIVLDENGAVVDVTGATIKFSMRPARDPATVSLDEQDGSVVNGPQGKIKYQWLSGQTDITAGTYEGEFTIDPAVGDTFRHPTEGFITVVIEERIGA
jgi:hypothetical protein